MTLNDKLEAFFKAHPNEWTDGKRLAEIAGYAGWRTRVSNLRTRRGMRIENRMTLHRHADGRRWKKTEYRYTPVVQASLLDIAS